MQPPYQELASVGQDEDAHVQEDPKAGCPSNDPEARLGFRVWGADFKLNQLVAEGACASAPSPAVSFDLGKKASTTYSIYIYIHM